MRAYDEPPERAEPPDDGERIERDLARGVCHECLEDHGPTYAEDVGHWVHTRHMECRDVDVETWTEVYEWSDEEMRLVKVAEED